MPQIENKRIMAAFMQVYPHMAEKHITVTHCKNIAFNMSKNGYEFDDLLNALLAYQQSDEHGQYCPTWKELWRYFNKKTAVNYDVKAVAWAYEIITYYGWGEFMRLHLAHQNGNDYTEREASFNYFLSCGLAADHPAYGGLFPGFMNEFFYRLHTDHKPAEAYEYLVDHWPAGQEGKDKAIAWRDNLKALSLDRQQSYFPVILRQTQSVPPVPDAVKSFMDKYKSLRKEMV